MNILTANAIKKYGVSIIEQQLKQGPVHVLKHNQPLFVVISEEEYQQLSSHQKKASGLLAMLNKPATGNKSVQEIDQTLQDDRDHWEEK